MSDVLGYLVTNTRWPPSEPDRPGAPVIEVATNRILSREEAFQTFDGLVARGHTDCSIVAVTTLTDACMAEGQDEPEGS